MFSSALQRYGDQLTSHDVLKAVAIILMVIDHLGNYFFTDCEVLRLVGRFSFPLFLFLVGYSHSYRLKYNLLVLAGLMLVQNLTLGLPVFPLNILFAILLFRFILLLFEKYGAFTHHPVTLFLTIAPWYFFGLVVVEYSILGLFFALCGYFVRQEKQNTGTILFFILTFLLYSVTQMDAFAFSLVYGILLACGMAVTGALLFYYRQRILPVRLKDSAFIYTTAWLSRYSLYIYALHVMLFKLLRFWLELP